MVDAHLTALIEQAGRNLDTLELLARTLSGADQATLAVYRERLHDLQLAYRRETNELTLIALHESVERRVPVDRRQGFDRRRRES